MQSLSLLLASVSAAAQSALPSPAPSGPAVQAAPPATTVIPDISLSWGGYFQALAVLCFILAAVWLFLWVIRRTSNPGIASAPNMRIESRLALGPKNWLYVVRCQNKRLILGVSEKNISLVSESQLTEEELQAPAKRSLFSPRKGKSSLSFPWQSGKNREAQPDRSRQTVMDDDFPLLQESEPQAQAQSAFDDFLQDEKVKPRQ